MSDSYTRNTDLEKVTLLREIRDLLEDVKANTAPPPPFKYITGVMPVKNEDVDDEDRWWEDQIWLSPSSPLEPSIAVGIADAAKARKARSIKILRKVAKKYGYAIRGLDGEGQNEDR